MNILMLYDYDDAVKFEDLYEYLQKYRVILHKLGHYVKISCLKHFQSPDDLNKVNIHYLLRDIEETDLLIFVSPIYNGRFSELMLRIQSAIFDYFTYMLKENNQAGHFNERKFKIPNFGVITKFDSGISKQEQLLSRLTQETNAAKFHTLLSFFITINSSYSEAVYETLKSFRKNNASYLSTVNEGNTVNK